MLLIAWLAAWLFAAARTLHRDERGQLGFFKELFGKAGDALGEIRDWVIDLGNKLWGVLAQGFALLRDTATAIFTNFALIVRVAGAGIIGALGAGIDKLWGVLASLGAVLRDAAIAAADKLWGVAAAAAGVLRDALGAGIDKLWGVIASAAGVLRDALATVGDKLWGVIALAAAALRDVLIVIGSAIADRITAGFNRVGDAADAATDAAKDGASKVEAGFEKVGSEVKDAFEAVFGFGGDFMDSMIEMSEAYMRGEITTIEQLLSGAHARRPHSSLFENSVYFFSFFTFIMTAVQEVGGVRAEEVVQHFRRDHPTALLGPEDIRDAVLRGIGNEQRHIDQLKRAGYNDVDIDTLRQLWQELPPPSDLIRMAVREAFNDPFAARFTTDAEFPEDFGFVAQQQGYSRDWAAKYWRAHWELPSAQQGFDMFHRGEITGEQLDDLLKALDFAPFWRAPLRNIAFNTVTRVDTRRLFAAGVWDRARVEREYLRQGYRPEDAAAITEWTVRTYGEDTAGARDLTQAAILQAFKQGRIDQLEAVADLVDLGYDESEADFLIANAQTQLADLQASAAEAKIRDVTQSTILRAYGERIVARGEAESMLADLGYTADGIELLLAVEDFNTQHDLAALRAKVIEQQFRQGAVTGADARSQLSSAGYGVERADLVVQRWEITYGAKDRDLTEAQLRNALQQGLIDAATYVRRVGALGYSDDDAKVLLALAGGATTEDVRQLSRAQVIDAYKRTIISRATAEQRLADLGFAGDDVQLQLAIADQDLARAEGQRQQREADAAAAAVKDLARTSIEGAYKRGIISRDDAAGRLTALGFRPDDAELLLQVVDAGPVKASP